MQKSLSKSFAVAAFTLGAAIISQSAVASPYDTVRWQSVIGIAQPGNVVGSGTGAVTGAPGPWSALDGKVKIDLGRGKVDFNVHGLVFAGGNFIGTPGSVAEVKGTLVCDVDGSASGGNSVLIDTPLVELGDDGDARFLGSVGPLPAACVSEPDIAFLVRTGSGRWIANGTVLK